MFSSLPPVRRPVPLRRGSIAAGRDLARAKFGGGREVALLGSGTEALALAIALAARRRKVAKPEVILPAYGCPDLVSACMPAGASAKLVDVSARGWGYDPIALRAALNENTVGIVAVDLLGVGDGADELVRVVRDVNVALIQDSAQNLARGSVAVTGDYFVLSFGRGKPMNLLRGGALVLPTADIASLPDLGSCRPTPADHSLRGRLLASRIGAIAFNFLSAPHLYHWMSRLPGTGLGATTFHPLSGITQLEEGAWAQVDSALRAYDARCTYDRTLWDVAMAEWQGAGIFPLTAPDRELPRELLRLPLLARDRSTRDALVAALSKAGLGATAMYGVSLGRLPGIPAAIAAQGPFANADALADRLFTLPTHRSVTERDVNRARQIVRHTA